MVDIIEEGLAQLRADYGSEGCHCYSNRQQKHSKYGKCRPPSPLSIRVTHLVGSPQIKIIYGNNRY